MEYWEMFIMHIIFALEAHIIKRQIKLYLNVLIIKDMLLKYMLSQVLREIFLCRVHYFYFDLGNVKILNIL